MSFLIIMGAHCLFPLPPCFLHVIQTCFLQFSNQHFNLLPLIKRCFCRCPIKIPFKCILFIREKVQATPWLSPLNFPIQSFLTLSIFHHRFCRRVCDNLSSLVILFLWNKRAIPWGSCPMLWFALSICLRYFFQDHLSSFCVWIRGYSSIKHDSLTHRELQSIIFYFLKLHPGIKHFPEWYVGYPDWSTNS